MCYLSTTQTAVMMFGTWAGAITFGYLTFLILCQAAEMKWSVAQAHQRRLAGAGAVLVGIAVLLVTWGWLLTTIRSALCGGAS